MIMNMSAHPVLSNISCCFTLKHLKTRPESWQRSCHSGRATCHHTNLYPQKAPHFRLGCPTSTYVTPLPPPEKPHHIYSMFNTMGVGMYCVCNVINSWSNGGKTSFSSGCFWWSSTAAPGPETGRIAVIPGISEATWNWETTCRETSVSYCILIFYNSPPNKKYIQADPHWLVQSTYFHCWLRNAVVLLLLCLDACQLIGQGYAHRPVT